MLLLAGKRVGPHNWIHNIIDTPYNIIGVHRLLVKLFFVLTAVCALFFVVCLFFCLKTTKKCIFNNANQPDV